MGPAAANIPHPASHIPEQERNVHMKAYLPVLAFALLPALVASAQPPAGPIGANQVPPGGQGVPGGPGPSGFGPPPNAMFAAIDVDGDGVITRAELRRAVVQLKKLDADQDGNITLAEVSGGMGPMPFGDPAQFVQNIMANDKNGDGKLTADELPEPMRRMLQVADQNGDGAIDHAELTAHMENMRNRFPGGPGGFPGGPGGFRGPGAFANEPFDANQAIGRLMQNDRNGDGRLSADEVPPQAMGMLQGADQDGDGAFDPREMQIIMRRMGDRARALGPGLGPNGGDDRAQRRSDRRNRQRQREENAQQ
jgi:Ca2+-binding EF-hand superfamily protein